MSNQVNVKPVIVEVDVVEVDVVEVDVVEVDVVEVDAVEVVGVFVVFVFQVAGFSVRKTIGRKPILPWPNNEICLSVKLQRLFLLQIEKSMEAPEVEKNELSKQLQTIEFNERPESVVGCASPSKRDLVKV